MKKISAFLSVFVATIICISIGGCSLFGGNSSKRALKPVLDKYSDVSSWNFVVEYTEYRDGTAIYEEHYEYLGENVLISYTEEGVTYTDYLGYNKSSDTYSYYLDKGDGTYDKYAEDSDEFEEAFSYLSLINPSLLSDFTFKSKDGYYSAASPDKAGNAVIGAYYGSHWTELKVYIGDGLISKVVGVSDDGYTMQFEFTSHGSVSFTLPSNSSVNTPDPDPTPETPTDMMEAQKYDPSKFDKENLQDKMFGVEGTIGLPSTGNIDALVIPVQFTGDKITNAQLEKLNIAFNGTSYETGWESVKTYYQKASYGKLNLSFDIQPVYQAKNTASYYERYVKQTADYTITGEELILEEALAYYESRLDLSKYDTNGDGCIDAVYLIYSESVDYYNADFYWAYVTWYYGAKKYDNLDAFYYLFAGFDFMDESTANDPGSGFDVIPGLKVNASTFIHETGHLLGLDDYYDYDQKKGANEGLGGADMMDYTVGDHNVYSKTMMGWLEPTIITTTQTITIQSSQASPSAILIPLDFNNSYFCEYLLIDLYSAQGLNALHSSIKDSVLYDGADFGVRIYHVSSSINNPYGSEFGSFTDNDNSMSAIALIKLVEADGERKFASTEGFASASDLWQAGDKLSKVFPAYTRNDKKKVNFDIEIVSVSAKEATVTITFK